MKDPMKEHPTAVSAVHNDPCALFPGQFRDLQLLHPVDPGTLVQNACVVGCHDACLIRAGLSDILKYLTFRPGIQGAGGLVQQKDRGVTQEGPCNGHPLGLAFRQASATFSQTALYGIGKLSDKVPGAADLQGPDDLFIAGPGVHDPHVIGDGAGHDGVSLGHIGKEDTAVRVHIRFFPASGTQKDPAGLRLDQAEDQADQGSLPLTGGAYQGNDLSGRCMQVGVFYDMGTFRIGKADIFHTDRQLSFSAHDLCRTVVFLVDLPGELDKFPDPVG